MNKRKILFITLSLPIIASCSIININSGISILSKFHSMDSSLNLMSDGFYNFHPKYDMNELKNSYELYLSSIKKEDIPNIRKCDQKFNDIAGAIIDNYYFKDAIYEGNPTESNRLEYLATYEDVNVYSIYSNNLVDASFKSGNKEIIKIVTAGKNIKPSNDSEREAELSLIMDDYANKANILVNNEDLYDEEELSKEGLKLFIEFAPYCKEMGELYDYDSYLDYAYEYSFYRKYTVEEAKTLTSNIRNYIATKYKDMDLSKYSESDQEKIQKSVRKCFAINDLNLGHVIDEYASFMGGSYLDIYKKVFTDGYYLFSSDPECLGTAFTAPLNTQDLPMLFYGNDYQNITTIIHEFGHCYAAAVYKPSIDKSLDINETYSQGNEVLFSAYLQSNYNEEYIKGAGLRNMFSLYQGLLKCSYAVDVENYLFDNYDTLSIDQLYDGIQNIYSSYSASNIKSTYWIYPIIVTPGYYISYVSSCVASLELYNLALNDFKNAKNIYMNLVNQKEMIGELEAWTKAGFASPFEENTIKEIANFFN